MADVIKVPNQWTLRGGDNPNESDSKRCEPFKSREFYLSEAEEKVKEIQSRRETAHLAIADLKMEGVM